MVDDLDRVALYKGYPTFKEAALSYNLSKSLSLVQIHRLAGDNLIYGPESEAVQDEIVV